MIFSSNVYQGAPAGTARQGQVPARAAHRPKDLHLLVQAALHFDRAGGLGRAVRRASSASWAPCPSRPDGSVAFHAPPGKALHFQLLDENYRALQTMRSFVGVMPGERPRLPGLPRVAQPRAAVAPKARGPVAPAANDHAAALGRRHGQLPALRPARAGQVLRQVPPGRRRGPQGARPDRPARRFLGFAEPYWHLIGRPTWGQPYQARRPAAGLRHRRHDHGRGLRHGRSGSLPHAPADDAPFLQEPADRASPPAASTTT